MAIKTYGLSFMSRWQSAVNSALQKETTETTDLSAHHPAMVASCTACETLETALKQDDDSIDIADVVTKGELLTDCAHMYIALAAAKFTGNSQRALQLESQLRYSVCDPLWAKALLHFDNDHITIPYRQYQSLDDFTLPLSHRVRNSVSRSEPAPRPDNAGHPQSIPSAVNPTEKEASEHCKIAFVSDWGTGTPLAKNVMRGIARQKPDIVIHLGDVYYSGTKKEMQDHFLTIVREYLPAETAVYNLAGNHDLYAGGAGYYWLIDELGQPASYFCLRNDHWQILSIGAPPEVGDPKSALSAIPAIDSKEIQWHQHKLNTAAGRKTVMLSHYQLFTASGNIGRTEDNRPLALNPVLYQAFETHLPDIDLWLWGHEHNLIAFEPYVGLRKGRCIGSGAIPVALHWQPYKQLPNLSVPDHPGVAPRINLDCQLGHDGDHYHHAFAVLEIDGPNGLMSYFQVPGVTGDPEVIYTESI